jgi:endoglucanase
MKQLIQKLVEIPGPSGYETKICEFIREEITPLVDGLRVDALGNLIARKGQAGPGGVKIMLSAHMDEIGLIVSHVDENGFARFTTIGGVRAYNLPGGRVHFMNGTRGVIGQQYRNDSGYSAFERLFIDVGARDRQSCPVRVGDIASFERPFTDLGDRMVSKAMDDRIGVAVLIETLRRLEASPHEMYFVFSVQEEVGLRGATTAAFGIDPVVGLAVDVTATGDTPKDSDMQVSLGKGPAVKVRDGGMITDPRVVDWMVKVAAQKRLPYQLEILEAGTTDARAIQVTRAGVLVGCISVPCRYIHSPSEMVDTGDVQNAVNLMLELLQGSIELG